MKLRGLAARPEMLRGSAASFSPDVYCSPDHLFAVRLNPWAGRVIVNAFAEEFH